ncbi:MAG: flagellar basal body L-ring protein FlgH [Nitrospinota bacterium]
MSMRVVHGFLKALLSGVVLLGVLSLTFGCAEFKYLRKKIAKPVPPRARFVKVSPEKVPEGSLWRNRSDVAFLFTDVKAFRVNDLLTIRIVESSEASQEATTKTGRISKLAANVKKFFGIERLLQKNLSNFDPSAVVDASGQNDFDGSGKTMRKEAFTSTLTARVVDVLPNGNLVIEGNREIVVNNEVQWISLTGIVRPRDVQPDNTVLSTLIADAQIEYTGVGVVSEKQRPGWIARMLDYFWPL